MQEYVSNNNEYQIITKQKKTFIKKNSHNENQTMDITRSLLSVHVFRFLSGSIQIMKS